MIKTILLSLFLLASLHSQAAEQFVFFSKGEKGVCLTQSSDTIVYDSNEWDGVKLAINNLKQDLKTVCGKSNAPVVVATVGKSPLANKYKQRSKLLKGKWEQYLLFTDNGKVVILGSDKRGTIYGIYELSRQIGVSPWHYWADVPADKHEVLFVKEGCYTDGEPKVKYRGIFINDEAPCTNTWIKNTFKRYSAGTEYYEKVFDLLLRLKGNYMWPAMWMWSFYADDPGNSPLADKMGIIMGTSHHEPMARNHQEWARHRKEYGEWDYVTNQKVIDNFFREGIRRCKDTEDIITIGMRGDGDTGIGGKEGRHDETAVNKDEEIIKLLERIVKNQRQIIAEETGRAARERPQLWALYKEVQRYYDKGLKVPDDVIILLADDNWGDIRRLPSEKDRNHKGGFGMYYHVDYVGTPRNTKWLNVTPIQHIWDQLSLTYQYGVDKLWILNVGDLKPMEYPISFFMDFAWNPTRYNAGNLLEHPRKFCEEQFGADYAEEASRILNLYSQYAGRVTPEMLDAETYNINTGEWRQVCDEFVRLEADALRQFITIPENTRDAYHQLILFPVQALSNLYEMYYAHAMNKKLFNEGNPEANEWADRVEECFKRDSLLCLSYNKDIAGGKWDGMMIQKHIGYTTWNDNFPKDICPTVQRIDNPEGKQGGYTFQPSNGFISMDAEHFYCLENPSEAKWTIIPYMGRTRSGISLQPYNASVAGSSISYQMNIPQGVKEAEVHVITASTLAFHRKEGHRYTIGFAGGEPVEVNFNGELNEEPENVYRIMYPTVGRRVIEKTIKLKIAKSGINTLTLCPLDPGVVLQKIVVDLGGYNSSYLFGKETDCTRK